MVRPREGKIRVLLIDDHPIVLLAVRSLFMDQEEFAFGGVEPSELPLTAVERVQPDIIILDLLLAGRNGLEILPGIRKLKSSAKVIVYSSLDERHNALRAFRAGVKGYLMKSQPPECLLAAARLVATGKMYASEEVRQLLMEEAIGNAERHNTVDELSSQQLQVFRLLGQGLATGEVAVRLGVSLKTIHTHRERIKNKLNLHSSVELIRKAEAYCEREGGAFPEG